MEQQPSGEPNKLYQLRAEPKPDYLFVHVSGEADSLEVSTEFWREVRDLVRQHQTQKVLVQENFANTIDEVDVYTLNNRMAQMGFFNTRIAFVDEQQEQYEVNAFGASVGVNKGLLVRVFRTVPEAEQWLRSEIQDL